MKNITARVEHGSPDLALTPLQKALLAESMVALDKGANVEQIVWELDRVPASDRFCAAWQAAIEAFDALRLAFLWRESEDEPHQTVLASVRLPFERIDSPERAAEDQHARLERFLEEDRRAGFDPSSPPMMRVSLLVFGGSRAVCVWTIHHAIIDGNCYAAVLQHVLDAYAGPSAGRGAAGRAQFTDFLRWLEGHDPVPGTRHFAGLLEGFTAPTPLPLQEGDVRTATNRSSQITLRLEPDATREIVSVARETGATPNTLVQLAWALLLSRYSGEDDVVFGATWAGRIAALGTAAQAVGPLINTLPVRVKLGESATVRDAIAALRRQHLATRPFQQTPAGRIKAASPLASSAHLFPTIVVFETSRFFSTLQAQDQRWRGHHLWSRSQANVPLALAAWLDDGALVLDLEYDLGLYTEAGARRLLADYARILAGLPKSLDRTPFEVPMLDPALRERLTTAEVQRELVAASPCAIERILARAAQVPEATAVKEIGGIEISYGELERRVRRLASVLQARGVKEGVLTGVLLSRSIDAIVSLLAVHAAGGAFVPLDPTDPPQRLEFMVRDSAVKLLLVNGKTRGRLEGARDLELDVDSPEVAQAHDAALAAAFPAPSSPAYVIYTSGSTGVPKGVCVSHGALANHLAATLELFSLRGHDRVLQFAALTFDAALEEIMPTLAAGATLVLRNDAMATSARGFFEAVEDERLTVLDLPTAFWHQLVRADRAQWPSCVRLIAVGGEQASPDAHRRFRAAGTHHIRWLNGYGPTEATITCTWYDDAECDQHADFVPIGRPAPGISHFVLDRHLRLTPVGQAGELYVGGAGLALGYLGREDLTRQRFIEHPFRPGTRLYATGDRVRKTEAGNYVYLGRFDKQVKVRGFRVELGGIEARLLQHPAVSEAAVVVHDRGDEEGSLVAFVAAEPGAVSPAQLREHLAATLPSYMVPARLLVVRELPTLSSGKIDRRALARRDIAGSTESAFPRAAGDPLVTALLEIWSQLLGQRVTDSTASFFDLGGDSLLAVEMFTEIDACLGRTCHAPAFLRNPTVSNLATLLRNGAQTTFSAPLMELSRGKPGMWPLFLAPGLSGRGFDYVHLARALSSDIPLYALQTSSLWRTDPGPESLRDLAAYFASRMQKIQPRGPYAVAGYSAAGVMAVAIAEELRARGESTDFVGLFDSTPPKSVPIVSPFRSPRRFARMLRTAAGRVHETLSRRQGPRQIWKRTRNAILLSFTRWNVLPLGFEESSTDSAGDTEARLSEPERERMRRYFNAIWNHQFGRLDIDLVLFRVALDPFEGPHEPELGWQRVTSGTIAVEYLRGNHDHVLTSEGCRELAPRLEAYLQRRECRLSLT